MNNYSIVLPVRNGGTYIKECVGSILAQTYPSFNLHVLDNCSTDGTVEWLQSLTDPRIICYFSAHALTIEESWARVVTIPKNEWITLIGHDDVLEKNYLATMDQLIQAYPGASLYQSHFRFINSEGREIRPCKAMKLVQSKEEFLEAMLSNEIDMMGTGFMMRANDYDAIGGIPAYPNLLFADFELMIELVRKGFFVASPATCFAFRLHQSTTTRSPDTKMQAAFDQLMNYFFKLKKEDAELAEVIRRYVVDFIRIYCKGLSHRLLRTSMDKRGGLSVKDFLRRCKSYADKLSPGNNFNPTGIFSVRLAKILDGTAAGRMAFLLFKKIYNKPVLK